MELEVASVSAVVVMTVSSVGGVSVAVGVVTTVSSVGGVVEVLLSRIVDINCSQEMGRCL